MRILCIGSEPSRVQAISEALEATAESCLAAELGERIDPAIDALVIEPGAFAVWSVAERERLRAETSAQVWAIVADDAAAALVAGADVVVTPGSAAEVVAAEVRRALAARRDRLRWPRSFATRGVLAVVADAAIATALRDAGFTASVADDGIHALEQLRSADYQAVIGDSARLGGSAAAFVEALHRYDPALGCALWVADGDEALEARSAGAAAVEQARPSAAAAVALAEAAWLAWSRAQPQSADEVLVLAVPEGVAPELVAAAERAGFTPSSASERGVARQQTHDAILTADEAVALAARPPVAFLAADPGAAQARMPWLAQVVAEGATGEELERALAGLARRARDARAFEALALRLHEVDARRVELLETLADRELELENLATVDAATETLNRRGIEDAVVREVETARRTGGTVAACLVGCDGLGEIRRKHGHDAGDLVLRAVGDRIKRALRLTDAIGRVGADELLLVLPQTRIAEALMVVDRACEAVAAGPIELAANEVGSNELGPIAVRASVNVGVAVLPWETNSLEDVVALTRAALAERRRVSDPPRDDDGPPTPGTGVLDLVRRLARGEGLRALVQPIVHVGDETVAAYEVLSRGPEGPYEAPEALLALARQCGMLVEVDVACLHNCLAHARKLAGERPIHLNLCPTTLAQLSTAELVALFADARLAPICLELSEDQFVGDAALLGERIAALRSAGVKLAIDDVGRGRGTLESVMLLEPDMVKIDRELISGACRDVRKERLLRRITAMAGMLGCTVVGEGVEQPEDLELLRELDVPLAQGYLWSAPHPPDQPSVIPRSSVPAADV